MIIQMLRFETKLPFEEVLNVAQRRAPEFREVPGRCRSTMFAQAVPTNTAVSTSGTHPSR